MTDYFKEEFATFPCSKESGKFKPTLEYRLTEGVVRFLYEDRGIAEEVTYIASAIYREIVSLIGTEIAKNKVGRDECFSTEGEFSFSEYGIRINVAWKYYNVGDESQITDEMRTFAEANITKGKMLVSLLSVGLEYNASSFKETIQHETMHFFENFKRGYAPYKGQGLYNKAYRILKRKSDDGEKFPKKVIKIRNYIAKIIYISTAYEQRAFANGAYSYLMSCQDDASFGFRNAMKRTKLFAWLKEVEKIIEFFNEYDGDFKFIDKGLEPYGLNFVEFMTVAEGAKKNITRQLGRIVSKAIDDVEKLNENTYRGAIIIESEEEKKRRRTIRWTALNEKYFLGK